MEYLEYVVANFSSFQAIPRGRLLRDGEPRLPSQRVRDPLRRHVLRGGPVRRRDHRVPHLQERHRLRVEGGVDRVGV